jgi:ABC-type dipeptide/oligopeptide/nickel transport system permease component
VIWFLVRRIAQAILVVIGVAAVIFFVMRLVPGDPARLISPRASEAALAAIRVKLGLDKPLIVQFLFFVSSALHGDLGNSYYEQTPTISLIFERLPLTLLLTGMAITLAVAAGLPLGFLAATHRDSAIDKLVLAVQMLFQSAPNFWVAMVLLIVFAVTLKILPAIGYDNPSSAVLPAVSLSIGLIAVISRVSRASMVEILETDMVKALRARGIAPRLILWRHALKNSLLPLLTLLGAQVGYLLGGAVIVEFIYNYPGLGLLTLEAVLRRDYPLVQAIVVVTATIFVSVNLLIDLSYGMIDPRIRYQR